MHAILLKLLTCFECCTTRILTQGIPPGGVKFQVDLPKALDWFQSELDLTQAGTSRFIKTNNTLMCLPGPETNVNIHLVAFYNPEEAGKHTPV